MVIPASRSRFSRLVRVSADLIKDQEQGPQRLVKAVLYLWQKASYPLLVVRAPYGTSALLKEEAVRQFSKWLQDQNFNDAAYWLSSAYAQWVGDDLRSKQSLYFTPPKLADRVIDDLVSRGASLTSDHWHDPACGGAAFLVPTAQRMAVALSEIGQSPKQIVKTIANQLSGNDLDETLLSVCEQFLLMALYSIVNASGITPTFKLKNIDGLLAKYQNAERPDVIVCNPPYRKLNAFETRKYEADYREVMRNQPNIYGLFIRKTLDVVKEGGLVGLLTPTSFLSGASFSKLRTSLLSRAHVLQVDMLSDRTSMFISVLQETVITVLKTTSSPVSAKGSTDINVLNSIGAYQHVGSLKLHDGGGPWSIPRSVEDSELIHTSNNRRARLSDYGYVAKVGHLVTYRDKRKRFPARPKSSLSLCIVPIVWAGDISTGSFEHGRIHQKQRSDYFVEVSAHDHVSVISTPSVVLQRLTSNDQNNRLIAAPVPEVWQLLNGGFVAENHVIVLQTFLGNAWSPTMMASLLNSPLINRLFRAISGAPNVAISELNELPLPDPTEFRNALNKFNDTNTAVCQAFGSSEKDKEKSSLHQELLPAIA